MKCYNCGHTKFRDGFLSGDRDLLYYVEGKPGFKNQLVGKKKRVALKICDSCGNCQLFAK